ncbi:MAG: hypothetical protein CM15mV92_440 [Caudoviricetes sp.]|nr:MAG: hypothetical protein CM15mV92_440 [Caudoviricetes sp.]
MTSLKNVWKSFQSLGFFFRKKSSSVVIVDLILKNPKFSPISMVFIFGIVKRNPEYPPPDSTPEPAVAPEPYQNPVAPQLKILYHCFKDPPQKQLEQHQLTTTATALPTCSDCFPFHQTPSLYNETESKVIFPVA